MAEVIIFLISLSAVIFGADWLGNSAVYAANKLSLPRFLIGATFVSLATTLPETAIAAFSSAERESQLAIGTVFGSPLVNIGLLLGILLLFSKSVLRDGRYLREVQIFLAVLLVVFLMLVSGGLDRSLSFVLILLGLLILLLGFFLGKQESSFIDSVESRFDKLGSFFTDGSNLVHIFYFFIGGVLLFLGAYFLVGSASAIATILGVPKIVIGVIAIAFGTSIPEAFTAINSIIKNRPDLSLGNLFGASIFDLTIALGIGGVFNSLEIAQNVLYLSVGAMALLAVSSLLPVFTKTSPRLVGIINLLVYTGFLLWFMNIEI